MKRNKTGFSLIEAIIVIVLLAILMAGLSGFIITAIRAWVIISGREAAVGNSRSALDRITSEIRRVKKPNNIDLFTSSQLRFQDITSQLVGFSQEGTVLMRNGDILATGLASPEGLRFTYLGQTGEVVTTKQNIRSIRVWLSLSSGDQRATLETSARIRNL